MNVWCVWERDRIVEMYANEKLARKALNFLVRNHPEKKDDYRHSCETVVEDTAEVGHTPGPWSVQGEECCFHLGNRFAITTEGMDEGEPWSVTIAEVWPGENDSDRHDANLIAAAPELLAALKEMMSLPGVWDEMACEARGGPDEVNQVADNAQAAINKAEGRNT